jgi:hypothetical protein
MNKIKKLYLDVVESKIAFTNTKLKNELISSKSAEITEQIAIEFAEWISECEYVLSKDGWILDVDSFEKSSKELFVEFLKEKNYDSRNKV